MDPRPNNKRPPLPSDGPIPLIPDEESDALFGAPPGGRDVPGSEGRHRRAESDSNAGDDFETLHELDLSGAGALSLADLGQLDDPRAVSERPSEDDEGEDATPSGTRLTRPRRALRPPPPRRAAAASAVDELGRLSGTTLGRYTLGALLGVGHHGAVFRADDTQTGRTVALKVLRPRFPKDDAEWEQFFRVLQSALPLRHPNLVTVFEVGRTGEHAWLTTDYVEGESVAALLQRGTAAGWEEGFRVAVHVGRALNYGSRRQFLHRSVTPRNVLLRGTDHLVKLADLPLARALAGSALRQTVLRQAIASDLPYFAPEQTVPKGVLDGRSDLYSLGAVVYALLTGRPPFVGKTAPETVRMIREASPERPTTAGADVPDRFAAIVLKLLAKRPQDRFQTAAELLHVLAQIDPDPV